MIRILHVNLKYNEEYFETKIHQNTSPVSKYYQDTFHSFKKSKEIAKTTFKIHSRNWSIS